jgi:putative transposase
VDLAERRWSADQSPFGGEATGPSPTDRGKQGTKRSVLTEGQGIPMAVVVAGANRHDMKLLADTLDAVVIARPEPTEAAPQHVCLDKGYDDDACRQEAEGQGYIPHIRSRGEERQEKRESPDYRPRRWVVEVCHSWLNRFRKLLVRFEKKLKTHLALLQFACAYIVLKRAEVLR